MTEKEAIRILGETNLCTPLGQAAFVGIESIKKLRRYRSMDERLSAAYGENNGLLETLVEYTLKWKTENKAGEMPAKTIMLTDEDVDRWNAYKKIGTVEECREAVERKNEKKIIDRKEIKDFQGLSPKSHDSNVPVYELEDSELRASGAALQGMKENRRFFYELYEKIANEIKIILG